MVRGRLPLSLGVEHRYSSFHLSSGMGHLSFDLSSLSIWKKELFHLSPAKERRRYEKPLFFNLIFTLYELRCTPFHFQDKDSKILCAYSASPFDNSLILSYIWNYEYLRTLKMNMDFWLVLRSLSNFVHWWSLNLGLLSVEPPDRLKDLFISIFTFWESSGWLLQNFRFWAWKGVNRVWATISRLSQIGKVILSSFQFPRKRKCKPPFIYPPFSHSGLERALLSWRG